MNKYTEKFKVGYMDLDIRNKLSSRALLGYLEDIATKHSNMCNIGTAQMQTTRKSWLLLNWKLDITRRPELLEEIVVETYVAGTIKKLYNIRNFVVKDANANIIATASSKWILFDIDKKRPVRITEDIRKSFGEDLNQDITDTFSVLEETQDMQNKFNYTVLRRDIDLNMHMHNIYYLDLVEEALEENIYKNIDYTSLEITFKKEFKLGDEIHVFASQKTPTLFSLKDNENNTHALVYLKK